MWPWVYYCIEYSQSKDFEDKVKKVKLIPKLRIIAFVTGYSITAMIGTDCCLVKIHLLVVRNGYVILQDLLSCMQECVLHHSLVRNMKSLTPKLLS